MKSLHEEIHFEGEICDVLAANGWRYSFDDTGYDRARALYDKVARFDGFIRYDYPL